MADARCSHRYRASARRHSFEPMRWGQGSGRRAPMAGRALRNPYSSSQSIGVGRRGPCAGANALPSGEIAGPGLGSTAALGSPATDAAGGGSSPALRPHAESPSAATSAPTTANLTSARSNVRFTQTPLNRCHHSRSDGRGERMARRGRGLGFAKAPQATARPMAPFRRAFRRVTRTRGSPMDATPYGRQNSMATVNRPRGAAGTGATRSHKPSDEAARFERSSDGPKSGWISGADCLAAQPP